MKIGLLGASKAGKTTFFSAAYYRFRNTSASRLPLLSEQLRRQYAEAGINRQMGFGLQVSDIQLEKTLSENAESLMGRPIEHFPGKTLKLEQAKVRLRFDFCDLTPSQFDGFTMPDRLDYPVSLRSYHRDIEIYDPPGEILWGQHPNTEAIIDELHTCDAAIAFIPSDQLLEAGASDIDEDEWAGITHNIAWGRITEIIKELRNRLSGSEFFPLCCVLSKSDRLSLAHDGLSLGNAFFYQRFLVPLSKDCPDFLICSCPISVVNPETGNFKATNLEWPFSIAIAAALMRSYQRAAARVEMARKFAVEAKVKADELEALGRRSLWLRFERWLNDFETINGNRRTSTFWESVAGAHTLLSDPDRIFANDIWSVILGEGRRFRSIRLLRGGRDIQGVGVL